MFNPLRKLYNWTQSLAYNKRSSYYLAVISFIESCVFPIPPDVLLLPMAFFNNKKGILYAFITTLFSVLGGLLGYLIGVFLYNNIIPPNFIIGKIISQANFNEIVELYKENVFWVVFSSALTPIPYKVFTIAGGYCNVDIISFTIASFIGRGGRFFGEGILFYTMGPTIKPFVEKNFDKLTILVTILLVLFYILIVKLF